MRKMKKINGYLVVRFNDRERRNNPQLGSYGIIDAEQYTGDLEVDLDAMEYTDADCIEIAVEQARGLESEQDFSDEPATYTVIAETAEEATEQEVSPQLLIDGWEQQLRSQVESEPRDLTPEAAVHELHGFKTALAELGLLEPDACFVGTYHFGVPAKPCCTFPNDGFRALARLGPGELAELSPHTFTEEAVIRGCTVQVLKCRKCGYESFAWSKEGTREDEETLAYVCDELCRFREGRTQEELDAICEKCKLGSLIQAKPREESPPGRTAEAERNTFAHTHPNIRRDRMIEKLYALGLLLARDCPANDCKVYLNIFNMARELDAALDEVRGYPALVLRGALRDRIKELSEMYLNNYAVQQFKEGMKS